MKIQILSDLYTEFAENSPPDTDADVFVRAGDTGVGLAGTDRAVGKFPKKPALYEPSIHQSMAAQANT